MNEGTSGLRARDRQILLGTRKTSERRGLCTGVWSGACVGSGEVRERIHPVDLLSQPCVLARKSQITEEQMRALDPDSLGFEARFCLFHSREQVSLSVGLGSPT